ncbi:MAG: DNA-3-methyladenine glycosylase I [Alphaproteobacteria bacterium GM202ARS2]|nr:DNA-3-methyladenine glycosylase I [Alphaproteobacteria bacterium GM202ARS2]
MSWYCEASQGHEWHQPYHDEVYGFPVSDDRVLFERLVLELNQAGLSWLTILRKTESFRQAYCNFDIETVAGFGDKERARLMADAGIIRNRLKIEAAIHNAQEVMRLQKAYGSFAAWLAHHHPRDLSSWVRLLRGHFRFMGPEIVNEFLMSIGYLEGAHAPWCSVYKRIAQLNPPWLVAKEARKDTRKDKSKD